jgi:hypothetical protein
VNGVVYSLDVHNNELIAGGTFTVAGGQNASRIARWNGVAWQSLAGGVNSIVTALATYNGELVAGGGFTAADGNSVNRIARWNGSTWQSLDAGMSSHVSSLCVYNGQVIAGVTPSPGALPLFLISMCFPRRRRQS